MALVGDGDNITRALAAIPTASRSAHSMYYAQEGRSRVLASQMGPVDLQVAGFRENNKWVFDSRSQKYTELAYPFSKSNKPNLDINYLDDLLVKQHGQTQVNDVAPGGSNLSSAVAPLATQCDRFADGRVSPVRHV